MKKLIFIIATIVLVTVVACSTGSTTTEQTAPTSDSTSTPADTTAIQADSTMVK